MAFWHSQWLLEYTVPQILLAENDVRLHFLRINSRPYANGEFPNPPFILYTGKGSEEIASEAISSGVTDYLQKASGSSHYVVLTNRIKNLAGHVRIRRELDRNHDPPEHADQMVDIGGWEIDLKTDEVRWTDGTYAVDDHQPDPKFFRR